MSQRKKDKRSYRNDFYRGEEKSEARTLFNPRSDNPIAFNKDSNDTNNNNNNNSNNTNNNNVRRKAYTSQRQQLTTTTVPNDFVRKSNNNNNNEREIANHLPSRPTGGVLWDPNSNDVKKKDINRIKSPSPSKQQQQIKPTIKKKPTSSSSPSKNTAEQNTKKIDDNDNDNDSGNNDRITKTDNTSSTHTEKATTKKSNKPNNNSSQRTQIKSLLNRMSLLESQIEKLSNMANQNPYFHGIHQEPGQKISRHSVDNNMKNDHLVFQRGTSDTLQSNTTTESSSLLEKLNNHPWLNMNIDENEFEEDSNSQWESVDQLWKEKMKLHIQLANTYLDIMQLDYEYAEKKNLESLCWKRAIYSLVEEFRQAFRRQQSLMALLHSIEKVIKSSSSQSPTTTTLKNNKKEKGEEEDNDEDDDNNNDEDAIQFENICDLDIDDTLALPVFSENGMTMLRLSDDDDDEEENHKRNITESYRLLDKHLSKLKLWMGTFLTLSDDFYERVMTILWKLDEPILKNEMTNSNNNNNSIVTMTMIQILSQSLHNWRRDRKWKWYKCISFRGDLSRYRYLYVDVNTYPIAWRWYTLGTWLIPATGRFYFHQSLLLNSLQYSSLYEFHKLYFGIKSLMVRRNPFVNSREGLIGLFENNRQWYSKLAITTTITTTNSTNNSKRKKKGNFRYNQRNNDLSLQQKQQKQKKSLDTENIDFDSIVTGTLIRLHGMLFTKIDLDTFAQTKRHYFDTLFPTSCSSLIPNNNNNNNNNNSNNSDQQQLSSSIISPDMNGAELYWLESALLNISSLYNFNYSTSPLTKLLSINKRKWQSSKNNNDDSDDNMDNEFDHLLESLKDNILFSYAIDLVCQTAVELLSRYIKQDELVVPISSPSLPTFPSVALSIQGNETFLFGSNNNNNENTTESSYLSNEEITPLKDIKNNNNNDNDNISNSNNNSNTPWTIYIELLLQWMIVSGICTKQQHLNSCSIWELLIGRVLISHDLRFNNNNNNSDKDDDDDSKVVPSFWTLLMTFLTKLFNTLPEEDQYQIMNWHLLDDDHDYAGDDDKMIFYWNNKYIHRLFKTGPLFPEEEQLRGVGWIDDLFIGKPLQDSGNGTIKEKEKNNGDGDDHLILKEDRIIRILNYGFWLVKQMNHVLEFDPVNKEFLVITELLKNDATKEEEEEEEEENITEMLPILTAMDDAVLFESDTLQDDLIFNDEDGDTNNDRGRLYNDIIFNKLSDDDDNTDDEDEEEDIMGQLKKRREQLQSMINTMAEEKKHLKTFGYQPLSNNRRMKERELRLNRLREKVIPGQTVLVFDTNCFIGHLDKIRKLFQNASWSIVIPLVVVTELDGLKGNSPPLGTIAENALELIETTLSKKPRRDHPSLRIQTSHHNFLNDISIRYEQFDFGETDKNLDDLVLSTCLWWMKKHQQQQSPNPSTSSSAVPVCLVTGDRNLSVKARARDVQVIPVSGLIEINP